jgi:hypothetical protein
MPHDFTKFDNFKKVLGNKWKSVSGYNIVLIDDLAFEGIQGLIHSAVLNGLDAEVFIDRLCRRAKIFYRELKRPLSKTIPNTICKGNLDKYLESGFE